MKATDIFGKYLRDMMSYVGWMHSKEAKSWWQVRHSIPNSSRDTRDWLIEEAHTFLSSTMKKDYFGKDNPMFKGEWEVVKEKNSFHKSGFTHSIKYQGKWIGTLLESKECKTLHDFATHCFKQGIELELNEEYEING